MLIQHGLAAFASCLFAGFAPAQTCPIVVDINTQGTVDSSSIFAATSNDRFAMLGSDALFAATTPELGSALYASDGTAPGTRLIKDINLTGHPMINELLVTSGIAYFSATNGVDGEELWKTDGTTAGTVMVRDIRPGPLGSDPNQLAIVGGKVVFRSTTDTSGSELWVSDGTSAGTLLLADIWPGLATSNLGQMTPNSNGTLAYFYANNDVLGYELWSTDGTPAGTQLLKDIRPGAGHSLPTGFTNFNGITYFSANDGVHGVELWKTDGTPVGTQLVLDIKPGSAHSNLDLQSSAEFNGELYFSASNGVLGNELWKTDGTAAGTQMVLDIEPGASGSNPTGMTVVGAHLYFQAKQAATVGRELFRIDSVGTLNLVRDVNPGPSDGLAPAYHAMVEVNGKLAFRADNGVVGFELWTSDGTAAGTQLVLDINSGPIVGGPTFLTPALGNSVIFAGFGQTTGSELWISDLTTAGTQIVKEIAAGVHTDSGLVRHPTRLGANELILGASDGLAGLELWKYGPGGATLIKEIVPGPNGMILSTLFTAWIDDRELVFMNVWTPALGSEPWVTDGTPGGTFLLKDLHNDSESSDPSGFILFKDRVYFSAYAFGKVEMYVTDGTPSGTHFFKSFIPGGGGSPFGYTVFDDKLFFTAANSINHYELWSSDGTAPGTTMVAEINPGASGSTPRFLTELNGSLYFSAGATFSDRELWVTDGFNVSLVADINPGAAGSNPENLVVMGGKLYFTADNGINGRELWKSDGTAAGTQLVEDMAPGVNGSSMTETLVVNDVLFFSADNGARGQELWKSDGTSAGTTIIRDIYPGSSSSFPKRLIAANGGVYFVATTLAAGTELWFSDGTTAGTQLVCDIYTGTASSFPTSLVLHNGSLLFGANNQNTGFELYELPVAGAYTTELPSGANGAHLTATDPILGSAFTVTGSGAVPGSVSLLLLSAPAAAPSNLMLAPANVSWIDPATASLLGWFLTSDWTWSTTLPPTPSLAGVQVNLQSYMLPAGSFPAVTSNALSLVVGL